MEKFKAFKQCGAIVGLKFQAAPDSATPDMRFEITRKGLIDSQGFRAVEIKFDDGELEIVAIQVLEESIEKRGLRVL